MKKFSLLVLVVIFSMLLTSCYINEEVAPNKVALETDGGRITECKSSGLHTSMGFFRDLHQVSLDTIDFDVSNFSVATEDTQIVSVVIHVQARRRGDCESLKGLYSQWQNLLADENLVATISATGGEAIKNGVRKFSLSELLNDRNGLADSITEALQSDADKYFVEIVNVIVNDVDVDDTYEKLLSEKALLTVQIETELRRQDLLKAKAQADVIAQQQEVEVLNAQWEKEKVKTNVQIEISSRESKTIQAAWQVFLDNPDALTLKQLELLQGVFGTGTKWVFLPNGADVTSIVNGEELIPIVSP